MKLILSLLASALIAGAAQAAIEEGYDARDAPIPSTWYGAADPGAMLADRAYLAGMRPHHAGALTMSEEYLADPAGRSPVLRALAIAIIRNQRFEIGLMDEVARNLSQTPVNLGLGRFRITLQPTATEGLAQTQRFIRSPIPGLADSLGGNPVSARDVQFARGMVIHHQAAVEMAQGYLTNPVARRGYLSLMNVDLMTDQTQEIALMQSVLRAYPGDVATVPLDPSMIHGMEGMNPTPPVAAGASSATTVTPRAAHAMPNHRH